MMILTDEEIEKVFDDVFDSDHCRGMFDYLYARAIEAKIMERLNQQEPVAYIDANQGFMRCGNAADGLPIGTKLYAAPVHLEKPVSFDFLESNERYTQPLYKLPEVKG
jgi:hypothetical protein